MYLLVPGIEPTPSVFLGECVIHRATVAETTILQLHVFTVGVKCEISVTMSQLPTCPLICSKFPLTIYSVLSFLHFLLIPLELLFDCYCFIYLFTDTLYQFILANANKCERGKTQCYYRVKSSYHKFSNFNSFLFLVETVHFLSTLGFLDIMLISVETMWWLI